MPKKQQKSQKSVGEISNLITGETLKNKIYTIRGQKVMLDYDLAAIYGYTTKAFNQQVARNIEKFEGEDFMFQLTWEELDEILRSQFVTSKNELTEGEEFSRSHFVTLKNEVVNNETLRSKNLTSKIDGRGGNRYLSYAFTEQGIYMLMTVLRGPLAVQQSRILIRLFKTMKDYIIENQMMLEYKDNLQIAKEVMANTRELAEVRKEFNKLDSEVEGLESEMRKMSEKLSNTVMRSEISPIMLDFNKVVEQKEFVFLDWQPIRAGELYVDLYGKAKKNIYVIDNYVGVKTLRHLMVVRNGAEVVILSDNLGKYLQEEDLEDFRKERPDVKIRVVRTDGKVHDRFIVLDFGEKGEEIYHCGASEKDAGRKMTMISKLGGGMTKELADEMVRRLMGNVSD